VVSYLLPISGRYGNTTIFSGVRVHLKKLPLTTPTVRIKKRSSSTDGRSLKLQYARFEIENGLLTNYLRFD
jgi:hypothetical protein